MSELEKSGANEPEILEGSGEPLCFRKVRSHVERYLAPKATAETEPYYFSPKHIRFMELYTETLDFQRACKESGLSRQQIQRNQYLINEIRLIEEAAMYKHRVKSAMGNHQRLMAKFENDYNHAGEKLKGALAGTLAKMSSDSLRSEGEFDDKAGAGGASGLQIFVNFSPSKEQGEAPVIDVEAKEIRDARVTEPESTGVGSVFEDDSGT